MNLFKNAKVILERLNKQEFGDICIELELAKLDIEEDLEEEAIKKFKLLLNSSIWYYAMFELALIYSINGEIEEAKEYLQTLINKKVPNKIQAKEELENIKGYKVKKLIN